MVGETSKPLCQIHPQVAMQYQMTVKSEHGQTQGVGNSLQITWAGPLCALGVVKTTTQNPTARNGRNLADTARARSMLLVTVHTSPELNLPQMVRPLTMPILWEPAPLSKANEEICQICSVNKRKRGQRTGTDRSRSAHSNPRLNKMTQMPLHHHSSVL